MEQVFLVEGEEVVELVFPKEAVGPALLEGEVMVWGHPRAVEAEWVRLGEAGVEQKYQAVVEQEYQVVVEWVHLVVVEWVHQAEVEWVHQAEEVVE